MWVICQNLCFIWEFRTYLSSLHAYLFFIIISVFQFLFHLLLIHQYILVNTHSSIHTRQYILVNTYSSIHTRILLLQSCIHGNDSIICSAPNLRLAKFPIAEPPSADDPYYFHYGFIMDRVLTVRNRSAPTVLASATQGPFGRMFGANGLPDGADIFDHQR